MNDAKEELGRKLVHFFEDLGLDPLYSITVLVIIVTLSYYKDYQRKEELPVWHRGGYFGHMVPPISGQIVPLLKRVMGDLQIKNFYLHYLYLIVILSQIT